MRLHTPYTNPGWKIDPTAANFWQRFALQTNGVVTPGNILSISGLVLVVWGAWLLGSGERWTAGVALVTAGRFFDVLDGYTAELTGTKSRLGAMVDVACDKL